MIPCANPYAQYLAHQADIDAAIARVLHGGRYILGEETSAFEREFADYVGTAHGIGVGSGTEALHLALRAAGVGPGDEVLTVSHTAVATVAAIELCGADPVLVDIEPTEFIIDATQLEEHISPRTKAVVPVHLYGQPADLAPVLEIAGRYGLRVIEDCAQAHGATYRGRRVGSWGDLGCFSFYPTKNLGALGDGGMVVTSSDQLAEHARRLREYGWADRYVSVMAGWNSRLDELQAAVLRVKLRTLDLDNRARQRLAECYDGWLRNAGVTVPVRREDRTHVYHLYVIRSARRDALREFLAGRGISTLIHYPVPVHLQAAYAGRLSGRDDLARSERAASEILSLPLFPELTESEVETVSDAVLAFGCEES